MKIQVLGSGCTKCKMLYEITQKAIIEMGIMHSPVLAVNGEPIMVGFTPDIEKIKNKIRSAS